MAKLPNLKPREVETVLFRAGFELVRTKGSHRTYYCRVKNCFTTVPFHPGDVSRGTLRAIIRQSEMTVEEFTGYLRKKR
ncbi:type II toxin-antitoxin system HicA family toxin [Patescibacteria group bacterium]|nr:type II toxin-antitoxin system HicA family toxin [Patescibacteria group bacterium]